MYATMTTQSPLSRICHWQDIYSTVKAQHPTDGRRKWKLRIAEQFWKLEPEAKSLLGTPQNGVNPVSFAPADVVVDVDPWDESTLDIPELGILVRTDYTNEDAWRAFHAKLEECEKELASEVTLDVGNMVEDEPPSGAQIQSSDFNTQTQEDEHDESSSEEGLGAILKILNPQSLEDRATLTSISNLSALRLLNDVDVRPAPNPPHGAKRIKPPNQLVDHDGWQEIYSGKMLWIYDVKSNEDQCVRMVNQRGDIYGTASGDSWRVKGSHICELQVNIHCGGMKIDFGGLDRWDYGERQRNMQEANLSVI